MPSRGTEAVADVERGSERQVGPGGLGLRKVGSGGLGCSRGSRTCGNDGGDGSGGQGGRERVFDPHLHVGSCSRACEGPARVVPVSSLICSGTAAARGRRERTA